jgi:hypothetical protein
MSTHGCGLVVTISPLRIMVWRTSSPHKWIGAYSASPDPMTSSVLSSVSP